MKITPRLVITAVLLVGVLALGLSWVAAQYGPTMAVASFLALNALCMPKPSQCLGAAVQIADIYNPLTFARRAQQAQLQLNRFIGSGIAVADPRIAEQIAAGGHLGELSNYQPLTVGEPNYSSDDPDANSTPAKIGAELQKFRAAARNKSWSTMDLSRELALEDPVAAITGRIGSYWATDDEQRIIASLLGILADNQANDSNDMVIDVATDGAGAVQDAERIGGERVIDGLQTLGDHKDSITTLAIHSQIHTRLQKQNLIQYVRDADNNIMFATYMGKRLIVDDSLPAVAGSNRITYTCVMFGGGVISTANGRVMVPSEMERKASAGNGGGQDVIHSRINNVWHVNGFSFLSNTLNGGAATLRFANYADLKLAANWNRVWNRKNIPLAFLKVND